MTNSEPDNSIQSSFQHGEPRRQRLSEWFLLNGNRLLIAAGITALFGLVLSVATVFDYFPLQNERAVLFLFSSILTANITLITIVVSINQLLLSRELKAPGETTTQIDNVVEYRKDVERSTDHLAPVEPSKFLLLLFENTRQEAAHLDELTGAGTPESATDEIDQFTNDLTEYLNHIHGLLHRGENNVFRVLSVTLRSNYAGEIHHLRQLKSNSDTYSEDILDQIDSVIDSLKAIGIARQYFKSIYLQLELAEFSRVLLLVGIPVEAITTIGILIFTANSSLPKGQVAVIVITVTTLAFIPLSLLGSFIIRISTVTKRTVATLPFSTPDNG